MLLRASGEVSITVERGFNLKLGFDLVILCYSFQSSHMKSSRGLNIVSTRLHSHFSNSTRVHLSLHPSTVYVFIPSYSEVHGQCHSCPTKILWDLKNSRLTHLYTPSCTRLYLVIVITQCLPIIWRYIGAIKHITYCR